MTMLALLRHGETGWSREGRIQGRTDIPLSEQGRASLAGRSLPPEWAQRRAVSSPLLRCVETAAMFGYAPVICDARLIEMSWGAWEGRRLEELREQFGQDMRANEALGLDFTPPGGESPREVFERVEGFLAEVAASEQPALAITHRGVIRSIFARATGWDMLGRPPARLDWEAMHVFKLEAGGTPKVYQVNVKLPRREQGEAMA